MRRKVLSSVFAVLMVALIAVACAAPAAAPTPTSTTAPTSQPPEVIELVGTTSQPPQATTATAMAEFAAKVEEASKGRVKFTLSYGGVLFESKETLKAMQSGAADFYAGYNTIEDPGVFQLTRYFTLPFLGLPGDPAKGTLMHRELLTTIPEMAAEWQGVKLLYPTIYGGSNNINTTKKKIVTGSDLKGMKIHGVGMDAKWLEAMGATPVNISFPDMYTSLEKGIVEGDMWPLGIAIAVKTVDLHKYHAVTPGLISGGYICCLMNPDSWNKLPADIQKIFEDLEPWFTQRNIQLEAESNVKGRQYAEGKGQLFNDISASEFEAWVKTAAPIHQQWAKDLDAKGLPGQKLYDTILKLKEKYK